MSIDIKVPVLPESVADATIAAWHKKKGDTVTRDENLLDLETDKVVLEVPAPADGVMGDILCEVGAVVNAGQLLGYLEKATAGTNTAATVSKDNEVVAPAPALPTGQNIEKAASPSARRLMAEHDVAVTDVDAHGNKRIMKEDVLSFIKDKGTTGTHMPVGDNRESKRVPMSRLRARIAERLVQAQHNAAMLTTFNEVDLHAVMQLRAQYKDVFEKKHGVKLGFMSFFVRAVTAALKAFPAVNASIDDKDILYHGFYDVGVAVSTERGLVVPVIRDTDTLSMAGIEKSIMDFATRARDGKLAIEEMQGGTFTITNGGVFGSLLATPIINPPQTAILGMHKIQERPVVRDGQIVIRPMMYIALSYDHRLIDGKESVQFLVHVKDFLEDPARLLLDI